MKSLKCAFGEILFGGESRNCIKALERANGHLLRHNKFMTYIIEGEIFGKRGQGKPKKNPMLKISNIVCKLVSTMI